MGNESHCHGCGLKIHEGEMHLLQTPIREQRSIKCKWGIHKYNFSVCLYENHEPLGIAIFKVCVRCGKGKEGPIAYEAVESVVKRATSLEDVELG